MIIYSKDGEPTVPQRLYSIDVFRAVTMLLMIFVNDAASVSNLPKWIDHAEAAADSMGFADTIFPAFLFIVGLSLPLAIQKKYSQGKSNLSVIYYILSRSVALLVMGFYHVNAENYSDAALLPRSVWTIIVTIGFFLIWLDYPKHFSRQTKFSFVAGGVLLLCLMAYLYKGGSEEAPVGMESSWWGILGIIGWAYLLCASLYFLCKGKLMFMCGLLLVLIAINIGVHADFLHLNIRLIGDGSSATLTMAGVVVTLLYQYYYQLKKLHVLYRLLLSLVVVFFVGGFMVRPITGGISKIYATPAWVFICTAISILFFEMFIYLVDVKEQKNKFKFIRPAGTSTLTCYLIPDLLYSFYYLVGFHYPHFFNHGVGGLLRSVFIAFLVVFIAGMLDKKGMRLRI